MPFASHVLLVFSKNNSICIHTKCLGGAAHSLAANYIIVAGKFGNLDGFFTYNSHFCQANFFNGTIGFNIKHAADGMRRPKFPPREYFFLIINTVLYMVAVSSRRNITVLKHFSGIAIISLLLL